ncbi:BlaI/MecI/CopY family transcriptional regulator [Parablautia muri]|uniref:BlaI/MecI/CopY family transcriptional regulator n=1 Tax=Parablautia muri TaxID=2320879 RepID=UPI00136F1F10|nr:BlaI/MecI/CopY family transcriptional regulator [Parablautia muri]
MIQQVSDSESDCQAAQTQMLLNKLYEGSARGLASTLIEREILSAEDYEELKEVWENEELYEKENIFILLCLCFSVWLQSTKGKHKGPGRICAGECRGRRGDTKARLPGQSNFF